MLAGIVDHSTTQRLHGLRIVLATQRDAIDTQQLIVHAQASVTRCGSTMDDILNKDPQVTVVFHAVAVAAGRGAVQIGACLALHTDAQAGLLRIVDGYVQRQLLPRMPATAAGRQAVLQGHKREGIRRLMDTCARKELTYIRGRRLAARIDKVLRFIELRLLLMLLEERAGAA